MSLCVLVARFQCLDSKIHHNNLLNNILAKVGMPSICPAYAQHVTCNMCPAFAQHMPASIA